MLTFTPGCMLLTHFLLDRSGQLYSSQWFLVYNICKIQYHYMSFINTVHIFYCYFELCEDESHHKYVNRNKCAKFLAVFWAYTDVLCEWFMLMNITITLSVCIYWNFTFQMVGISDQLKKSRSSNNSSSSWTLTLDYDELQFCCINAINEECLCHAMTL